MHLNDAIRQQSSRPAVTTLRRYESSTHRRALVDCRVALADLKQQAVANGDQVTAKAVWCLETIANIHDGFLSVFSLLRRAKFQRAWDELERIQIQTSFLDRHFVDEDAEFGIEHIRTLTERFQELYPFTMGVSPGYLYRETRCTICHAKRTPRGGCDHQTFEIYDGEMCGVKVMDAELLHIAFVDNPSQKYSVVFPNGDNDRRLFHIKTLVDKLPSPWVRWNYYKQETPDPVYHGIRRNTACPCGSARKYKHCCLGKEPTLTHFHIYFEDDASII